MKKEEVDEEAFLNLDSSHLKEMGQLFDIFLFLYSLRQRGAMGGMDPVSRQKIKSGTTWYYTFFINKHMFISSTRLRFHGNFAYLKHISNPYNCILTHENATPKIQVIIISEISKHFALCILKIRINQNFCLYQSKSTIMAAKF